MRKIYLSCEPEEKNKMLFKATQVYLEYVKLVDKIEEADRVISILPTGDVGLREEQLAKRLGIPVIHVNTRFVPVELTNNLLQA